MNLKYVSLVTLSLQNALFAVSVRYSRTREGDAYFPSTVVLNTELAKFVLSLYFLYVDEGSTIASLKRVLYSKIFLQPFDTLKVCVPSFVYVIQNNLLYFAASHLDAPTFQITFQLKLLTTALFSVILLQKKLLRTQWLALFILLIGVTLVELTEIKEETSASSIVPCVNSSDSNCSRSLKNTDRLIGITAAILAACCSGFAGTYFEKILKGSSSVSLWLRNVQLSFCSLPFGMFTCMVNDWNGLSQKGFFHGYDWFIIYLILLQSFGGILVGLVVKFADNLLKGFAAAFAIVLACSASSLLFNLQLTSQFMVGTFIIIISIILYSYTPKQELVTGKQKTEHNE